MKKAAVPWYEFAAQSADDDTTAELRIFGPIGGGFFADPDAPSGKRIAEELEALPESTKTIRVLVNSPGGSAFDGIHIANALRRQREELGRDVVVEIEALAASAATLITSAGDPIRMPKNALMMIHNPSAVGIGDAKLMRDLAGVLDKVRNSIINTYRWVSRLPAKKLGELMDETTWLEAAEALEIGLATEISDSVAASAFIDQAFLAELDVPAEYADRVAAMFAPAGELEKIGAAGDEAGELEEKSTGEAGELEEEDTGDGAGELEEENAGEDAGTTGGNEMKKTPEQIKAEAAAAKAERDRIQGIRDAGTIAERAGLGAEKVAEIEAAAIGTDEAPGFSADQAREQFFSALAEASAALPPVANGGHTLAVAGDDEHDKRVVGIQAALWRRAGVTEKIRQAAKENPDHPAFESVSFDPGEFRGLTLAEHCREDLERQRPGSTKGQPRMKFVGDFLNAAGGYQSTSDFAIALENALHKTLMASYMTTPDTWSRWCAIGEVQDFRAHRRHKSGFLARLTKVLEDGEFTHQAIPDTSAESITAETFGNIVTLTRQAIINDDMSVFSRLAVQLGRAARLTIEREVYDTLLENSGLGPTMGDTNPLFDAAHSNLGAGAAITIADLDANAAVMAAQTDASGNEILDLQPSILLVPRGLRGVAITLTGAEYEDHNRGAPNRIKGIFSDIVASARLTGTRRYMFADPQVAPVMEVAFLEGEQEPFMEMKDGWNVDGVEWKVRHDIAVAAVDWRGAVTDAGA